MTKEKFRESFFLPLLIVILITIILAATVSLVVNYNETNFVVKEFLSRTSNAVNYKIELFVRPVVNANGFIEDYLAMNPEVVRNEEELEILSLRILERFPSLVAFNFGYENGDFFMVKRENDKSYATKIIRRNDPSPHLIWRYRDAELNVTSELEANLDDYDPRVRPWYLGAKESGQLFWSDIYIFFTDQVQGITVGQPIYEDGDLLGVYSFDLKLEGISDYISGLEISENGEALIVNYKNNLIAFRTSDDTYGSKKNRLDPLAVEEINDEVIKLSYLKTNTSDALRKVQSYKVKGKKYYAVYSNLNNVDQNTWRIGVIIPENDFVAGFKLTSYITAYTILIIILFAVLLNYYRYSEKRIRLQLIEHSERDALTDLLNRRSILKIFDVLMHKKEVVFPMGIVIADIDHFKNINDSYGHNFGDHVLKEMANILSRRLRESDFVSRWGGEEFLILLPQADEKNSINLAESLRKTIESHVFCYEEKEVHITMSFGITAIKEVASLTDCIKIADDCLYEAKASGRNKVLAASSKG